MRASRSFLESIGLPGGDLRGLPESAKRFADGARYRVEIPSCEGPRCLEALLEAADRLDVRVHRASQGSGVFMLTDAELAEMAAQAREATVEISLFARPNAAWDTSGMARTPPAARSPRPRAARSRSSRGWPMRAVPPPPACAAC